MEKSCPMTNKKCYISIATIPFATKLDMMVVFGKEPQSTKLHVVLITWSREVTWRHMTKKKCYISTSIRPMATRCDTVITVVTYENSSTPTIVTWKNNHVTNKTRYISISTRLMATKLNKVIAYDIESPLTKSYDSLTTWSYVVSW